MRGTLGELGGGGNVGELGVVGGRGVAGEVGKAGAVPGVTVPGVLVRGGMVGRAPGLFKSGTLGVGVVDGVPGGMV